VEEDEEGFEAEDGDQAGAAFDVSRLTWLDTWVEDEVELTRLQGQTQP